MSKKHHVKFIAHEKVKEPVIVDFFERNGTEIKFPAHKKIKEEVLVDFMAKNK